MIRDGRQYAPTIDGIRDDHVNRYRWATDQLMSIHPGRIVLDVGCGCGYGSWLLANAGFDVTGMDISSDAIRYAEEHYRLPNVNYIRDDVQQFIPSPLWYDAAVAFEIIEHLENPTRLFKKLSGCTTVLLGSVPNEDVIPYDPKSAKSKYHYRHYRPLELEDMLASEGWHVISWWHQAESRGPDAQVRPGAHGHTMVFVAKGI